MLACRVHVQICIGDELGRSMGRPVSCPWCERRDLTCGCSGKGRKGGVHDDRQPSWACCMCRSNGWPQGGLDARAQSCVRDRELPCRWSTARLRLSGNFGWAPLMYLTTRSASFPLGLLGTRQRAALRCGAMLPWMVLALSRPHARAGIREGELPSSQSFLFFSCCLDLRIYIWGELIHTRP